MNESYRGKACFKTNNDVSAFFIVDTTELFLQRKKLFQPLALAKPLGTMPKVLDYY